MTHETDRAGFKQWALRLLGVQLKLLSHGRLLSFFCILLQLPTFLCFYLKPVAYPCPAIDLFCQLRKSEQDKVYRGWPIPRYRCMMKYPVLPSLCQVFALFIFTKTTHKCIFCKAVAIGTTFYIVKITICHCQQIITCLSTC